MIRIGKIVATHGLRGEVVLSHIIGRSDWLKKDTVFFLELVKGSFIPYFLIAFRGNNTEEYLVAFEDVSTAEEAKKLIGKQVYLQEEILATLPKDSPLLYIGFNLVDKVKGTVGVIEDVYQAGPQWLGKLQYEGREVLVPLISQWIIDVNLRNKFIRMELPDGLLEL